MYAKIYKRIEYVLYFKLSINYKIYIYIYIYISIDSLLDTIYYMIHHIYVL